AQESKAGLREEVLGALPVALETGRVTERCRSRRPLATAHADDRYIVKNALGNRMMNATQLQGRLREVRGTQVSRQTIENSLHQRGLSTRAPARVPDRNIGKMRQRLTWARESLRWTKDQWASVLRALCISLCCQQTSCWWWWCYSVGRCVQSEQTCPIYFVNITVTIPYYLNNIIN
uniref:Transposase Tc1-like domain-containing protein n=1 Tax=Hippocampus comes TaxID=109280 RepID=A0A3Q2ZIR4_HIPCM